MKINSNDLNRIKDYKDVDLELINVKINNLSPTIKDMVKDDKYIDVEEMDTTTNNNEINEDDTYKDNSMINLNMDGDKQELEINLDSSKEILEVVVFEELDTMLNMDYNSLEEDNLEIEILNNLEEDKNLKEEAKILEEEFNNLIDKFKNLSKIYENIYENIDYTELKKIDEEYIKYLINDYNSFLNTDILNDIISSNLLKEYVDIINNLIDIDNRKNTLEEKIDDKKDVLNIDEVTIEKMKDQYIDIDKTNDKINNINNNIEKELKNIKELVKNNTTIKESIQYKKKLSFSLGNVIKGNILLATSKLFPPTKKGNIFRIGFIIMGINNLSNVIREEKVKEIKYSYDIKDYSKEIKNNIENVNDAINSIEDAFININEIRKKIKNEFKDYINEIPEAKELLININKLEKELNIRKDIAKNYNNEFRKTLQENNEKIKKLDKYDD